VEKCPRNIFRYYRHSKAEEANRHSLKGPKNLSTALKDGA
jgi:hypothetical protein